MVDYRGIYSNFAKIIARSKKTGNLIIYIYMKEIFLKSGCRAYICVRLACDQKWTEVLRRGLNLHIVYMSKRLIKSIMALHCILQGHSYLLHKCLVSQFLQLCYPTKNKIHFFNIFWNNHEILIFEEIIN